MAASKDSVIINPATGKPYDHWVLSVDFGTSSTIAVVSYGDSPDRMQREVIEFEGERRVPSAVLVDDDGSLVVGHAAAHLATSRPDRVIRTPKRRLGDQRPVILGGQAHQPVDLATAILRHVAEHASARMGSEPSEVRLTHPVTWNRPLQQRLLEAAAKAGLANAVLIPEPVAAAMSLGLAAVPAGQSLAIYDLGGGTFDTTVVRSTGAGFEVLGDPVGDPTIGGELFDEMLMNLLGERLDPDVWEQMHVADDVPWRQAAARMLAESQRVKEALSVHDYAEAVIAHPQGVTTERVTRAELEQLIEPYIAESIRLTNWSLVEAGVLDSLAGIRLIGGASRMPIVARMLDDALPDVEIQSDHDPRTAVAMGATTALPSVTALVEAAQPERSTLEEDGQAPVVPDSAAPISHTVPTPPTAAAPPTAAETQFATAPVVGTTTVDAIEPASASPLTTALARIDQQSPVVLGLVGMLAVFLFAGAIWIVWPRGNNEVAANDLRPSVTNSVVDGGGGSSVTLPPITETTLPPDTVTTLPETTVPPTTVAPPPTVAAGSERLQSVLLDDEDMGAEWESRTYTVADDADLFCDIEPPAVPVFEEGRAWDSGLLSFSHILYEYETEQDAIDVLALDRVLAEACPSATQEIYGAEFTVGIVQDEGFTIPENMNFGDETASAGFVLLATDVELTIYAFTFEQRWGRTVAQTVIVSTEEFDEAQLQQYLTRSLTAFQRHVTLER